MPKTKEQVAAYNKEYFARPQVIARARVRNAERRHIRAAYKKTEAGIAAEKRYRQTDARKRIEEGYRLKTLYGITIDDYESLLEQQAFACAICRLVPTSKLHVDHCHDSGKVRGLLCGSCNRAIGLLKDDIERLLNAVEYLK